MLTLLLPLLDLYIMLNLAYDMGEATKDLQCIMWLNHKSLKHILGTGVKNLRTRLFDVLLTSLHLAHLILFIVAYLTIRL
jgi:hypothetical protein